MLLIAVLAVVTSLGTATVAPAQSCGKEAREDAYDNGTVDRSWSCECLLDGLTQQPNDAPPVSFPTRLKIERRLRAECTGWRVPVSVSEVVSKVVSEAVLETTLEEFDPIDTESTYSVPWEIVIASIVSGGLVILIGAAAIRQWRLRP